VRRYGSEHQAAHDRALAGLAPSPEIFEVHPSGHCQAACEYCHSSPTPLWHTGRASDEYLRATDFLALLPKIAYAGFSQLVLSGGGEPTLHPQFARLVEAGHEAGFAPHIYTNGATSERFTVEALSEWLPRCRSIRFSIHPSLVDGGEASVIFRSIRNAVQVRREMTLHLPIHASVLVETWPNRSLGLILEVLSSLGVDVLELRNLLPLKTRHKRLMAEAISLALRSGIRQEQLDWREQAGPGVPTRCFAPYRTLVLDPRGAYRLCCMRAHLPSTDFSYLGAAALVTPEEALVVAVKRMLLAGPSTCDACSYRDRVFSSRVAARLAENGG